ncbi:MAG TPA: putative sulfate exporter family transporter [Chloroflexi bacterium]|nr:putative sulfate exporter family transporter [Chloroflexota bacterium]
MERSIKAERATRLAVMLKPWQIGMQVWPGLLLAVLVAILSIWLSEVIGVRWMGFEKSPVSSVMMAIVLGLLAGNLFTVPARLKPGLKFAVKKLLRVGIILLGIRLSLFEVLQLGGQGLPIVVACIVGALLFTTAATRWLKLPARLGALIAVGSSICGVSAILATAPAIDAEEEEVAYAVAVITVFGIVATLLYPYLAHWLFGGDPVRTGLFLGTAIHDTSQVTGAGLVYADLFAAPQVLDVATVTKLVRNVFLVLVVPLMALHYARTTSEEGSCKTDVCKLIPFFILGFLALAAVRTLGDAALAATGRAWWLWDAVTWRGLHGTLNQWAVNFLAVALAGVGLSTRFSAFKGLGFKPFVVGLIAALTVGGISIAAITLLVGG